MLWNSKDNTFMKLKFRKTMDWIPWWWIDFLVISIIWALSLSYVNTKFGPIPQVADTWSSSIRSMIRYTFTLPSIITTSAFSHRTNFALNHHRPTNIFLGLNGNRRITLLFITKTKVLTYILSKSPLDKCYHDIFSLKVFFT